MTKWYRDSSLSKRTILPTALAVASVVVGVAVWAAGPYNFDGSDTLGDVAPETIATSGASLTYRALGSGTAENNMNANPPTQSCGFMSRNFKSAILTNHPGWQPGTNNVLGLDAASVVAPNRGTKLQDVSLPQDATKPGHALPESTISLVLSGKFAAGTAAACRHPDRLAAIDALSNAMGGAYINHFFRRNDASGTSDTIRERVLTTASGTSGGRFCNGQAPGGAKSDGVTLYTNLDVEDMDPVRRDCVGAVAGQLNATKCVFWPYNVQCTAGTTSNSTNAPTIPAGIACTQGLVVALTQADPGQPDVTVSIANRVFLDDTNGTLGYAGREAVRQGSKTFGPTINRISNSDLNVRGNAYPLSRRLFLNHGDQVADSGRQTEETTLYNFATGDDGRCNMHPIMKKWGFVTCYQNCNIVPIGYNLCDDSNIAAAETTMGLCTAEGKTCAAGALCCDGSTCPVSLTCPVTSQAAAAGEACATNGDCQSGLTCQDLGGPSTVCHS